MSSRKQCVNVPSASYSGKEKSPLHYGISAEGYEINTIMDGYDKMKWIVVLKNNKKVWVRQTLENTKMTREEPIIEETNLANVSLKEEDKTLNEKQVIPQEQKKVTDYNLFLTYKLNELKKNNKDKKINNKELFNQVLEEWKELKKKPQELAQQMAIIKNK